ncbi:hypothetical protein ABT136_18405, partial [Streptomyces sp. NPDC001856]|uniref:hypothetical protein n=1 Tax=Streptomyces sp. NPDC001856 TaxID=3154399 RepID=UPI00332D21E5
LDEFVLLYPVYALLFADTGLSVWQMSSLFVLSPRPLPSRRPRRRAVRAAVPPVRRPRRPGRPPGR